MINQNDWEWFGVAGHFICGHWCRFHLCTVVGPWVISTVGEYVHPRHSGGSEQKEMIWLKDNWPGEDVGLDRKYESMVFLAGDRCVLPECMCGMPVTDGYQRDFRGYDRRDNAARGHIELCKKWSNITKEQSDAKSF